MTISEPPAPVDPAGENAYGAQLFYLLELLFDLAALGDIEKGVAQFLVKGASHPLVSIGAAALGRPGKALIHRQIEHDG